MGNTGGLNRSGGTKGKGTRNKKVSGFPLRIPTEHHFKVRAFAFGRTSINLIYKEMVAYCLDIEKCDFLSLMEGMYPLDKQQEEFAKMLGFEIKGDRRKAAQTYLDHIRRVEDEAILDWSNTKL